MKNRINLLLCLAIVVSVATASMLGQPTGPNAQRPAIASPDITMPAALGSIVRVPMTSPMPNSVSSLSSSLLAGGNRLAATQNPDGGWGWPVSGVSASNTVGPIAMGLAQAYQHTKNASQRTALVKAGAFLLAKTNTFSPSDGYLAAELDKILGGATYSNHVKTNFYHKLAAGTYQRSGDATFYTTASYIARIRTVRSGSSANLAAWDIGMGLVGAAACGAGTGDWIAGVKAEIDELDGNIYDVIGLAGALFSLAYVNEDFDPTGGQHAAASNVSDLAAILAGYQISGGGFTWNSNYISSGNETNQETAYAILALNQLSRATYLTGIQGAANYLMGVQLGNGGWDNYVGDPSGENNEITGESLWGIRGALANSGTVTVYLKDSHGVGLLNGVLKYYAGSPISGWVTVGTTNANGMVSNVVALSGTATTTNFMMHYAGGSSPWNNVNVTANPTHEFTTTPVTVKLETCLGTVLAGNAYWYAGSALGGYSLIGTTPAIKELLPGSYTFRVNYSAHNGANSTFNNTKIQDISSNSVVVFNTTKVSISYSGPIYHYENSPTSGWVLYTNPSEMLPGTVRDFKFGSTRNPTVTLVISGCSFVGSYFTANLKSSTNVGLSGGVVTYYKSGWQPFGTTGPDGSVSGLISGVSCTDLRVVYKGMSQQTSGCSINPNITFSKTWWTTPVQVKLQTCSNTDLVAAASAYFGGSLGNTPTTPAEMLGGTNTFYVMYGTRLGTIANTPVTVATGPGTPPVEVVFHTTLVTYPANTYYYRSDFGFTLFPSSQEMIAGSLDIKLGSPSSSTVHDNIPGYPTCTYNPYGVPKTGDTEEGVTELPAAFGLSQNYPNPFNPSTTIRVALPVDATISLVVYNTLGQKVAELMNGTVKAGYHEVTFDASNIASGLYIYRFGAKGTDGNEFHSVQKMVLMK